MLFQTRKHGTRSMSPLTVASAKSHKTVAKHVEKAEIKVKKRATSKSAGHGNKHGTDSKTSTSNKASASLNEPLRSHSASSGKFESVAFVEKPQSRTFSDMSSRTEEYLTEAP